MEIKDFLEANQGFLVKAIPNLGSDAQKLEEKDFPNIGEYLYLPDKNQALHVVNYRLLLSGLNCLNEEQGSKKESCWSELKLTPLSSTSTELLSIQSRHIFYQNAEKNLAWMKTWQISKEEKQKYSAEILTALTQVLAEDRDGASPIDRLLERNDKILLILEDLSKNLGQMSTDMVSGIRDLKKGQDRILENQKIILAKLEAIQKNLEQIHSDLDHRYRQTKSDANVFSVTATVQRLALKNIVDQVQRSAEKLRADAVTAIAKELEAQEGLSYQSLIASLGSSPFEKIKFLDANEQQVIRQLAKTEIFQGRALENGEEGETLPQLSDLEKLWKKRFEYGSSLSQVLSLILTVATRHVGDLDFKQVLSEFESFKKSSVPVGGSSQQVLEFIDQKMSKLNEFEKKWNTWYFKTDPKNKEKLEKLNRFLKDVFFYASVGPQLMRLEMNFKNIKEHFS
ncbi:MAG: hypothetical protein JNK65_06010, partial [Deltaproteobacteria bacterium]|nr:hypothetical protein [Deltaproteobacteria bacterium]